MSEDKEDYAYIEYPEEEENDGYGEPEKKPGEWDVEPEIAYVEDEKIEYKYKPINNEIRSIPHENDKEKKDKKIKKTYEL